MLAVSKMSPKPCPGSALVQTPLTESASRTGISLVAMELKGSSTFVMIQQMLRLRSQELPNAEADGSLPCYLRWMTCWILTLGFPEPRARCARVRFRCTGARDVLQAGLAPCRPRAGAGRERSQRCVAPGPGSCRPTRPLGSAMRSLFAAAAARGGPCQVSS